MVKNTHGGNRHKAFARKHAASGTASTRLRTSVDDAELYAVVTKMLGNGMFHCHCIDNVARLGHIRGKFSGRRKSSNWVSIGSWVLVGLREWDVGGDKVTTTSAKAKYPECDLLELYDEASKERLMEVDRRDWNILKMNDVSRSSTKAGRTDDDDDIVFTTERDEEMDRLRDEMKSGNTERIAFRHDEAHGAEDEINIDDI